MAEKRPSIVVTLDRVAEVAGSIEFLASQRLMIGIPAEKTPRTDGPINNASLLYIHEHGAPEAHIPQREVLKPTIKENLTTLIDPAFKKAGTAAFSGQRDKVEQIYGQLGQKLADACRDRIVSHIPPPLKEATVLARTTRTAKYKSAKAGKKAAMREHATTASAIADAVPLFDTGQMARAITWVIRKLSFRKR